MQFSIVTPSFRQFGWLKRCIRSVADQRGVEVEHIIQDGGTGSDLERWVRENSSARLFVEKDSGMYDALNRAIDRTTGEIIGHLNCDEQYLPGALARVARCFERSPEVDIIAGDYLVVDNDQRLIAFRKVTPLRASMIATDHLYAFTCSLFYKRSIFDQGFRFDAAMKSVADADFVVRVLNGGFRSKLLHQYLAAFTWTGENLSARAISHSEAATLKGRLPKTALLTSPFLRQWRHVERLFAGGYWSAPIGYAVYAGDDDATRTELRCDRPNFRYPEARPSTSAD